MTPGRGGARTSAVTTPPPYADADRPARLPVWEALSELWLDTEMTDSAAHWVVRTVLASPYSVDEAEAIHWHEVAPAVYFNALVIPGGVWTGFDLAELAADCERQARRRPWWRPGQTRVLRWLAGGLPDLVFERARRAERDGFPPIPTGPSVSLVVSDEPFRYCIPW